MIRSSYYAWSPLIPLQFSPSITGISVVFVALVRRVPTLTLTGEVNKTILSRGMVIFSSFCVLEVFFLNRWL